MLFVVYYPLIRTNFHLITIGAVYGMTEQDKSEILVGEKLLSTSEVLRVLNIAKHKLDYLFESRKLTKGGFYHPRQWPPDL